MRLTFRAKLLAIVGSAALAFLILIVASTYIASRVEQQLTTIQERYVPKVELGPQLEAEFDSLRRGFQDAVAAHDVEALDRSRDTKNAILDRLASARGVVDPKDAAVLRDGLEDYYRTAYDVSRRMIADETGERIVDAMAQMQVKHTRTAALIKTTTSFDERELNEAFSAASAAEITAGHVRLGVSAACLSFVLVLSLWLSRGVLRSLAELRAGFARFGEGDFQEPIRVANHDELAEVAAQANRMAVSLERLGEQHERTDWLKTGQTGLAKELRGELEPKEVASRAARYIASYLEAPAAALYGLDSDLVLRLLGRHALSLDKLGDDAPPTFRFGEGLLGQAALQDDIVVVPDPPADYLRIRSGLGEGAPRVLVFLPLVHSSKVIGVLELAFFKAWSERSNELLLSVRESVAVAIEIARARSATRQLLTQAQQQALRLSTQEEELRASNEELQTQQEELRQTNEELTQQAEELEQQRRTLETKNAELQETRRSLEQKAKELATVSTYKSQFLANMSHELRTPLNSMLLLSNLLAENDAANLTEKQVEFSKTIHSAGKDLLALINQVLDLAKIEAGKQDVSIEPVRLQDIVDNAERSFGPLARHKRLRFVVDLAPGLPETISTDRQRLAQILNNLLANAIKFTEHGQVALHIGRPDPGTRFALEDLRADRAVSFTVNDTGVGIAPEHHDRVFAPFEQVEAASDRRFGGTGLGLSIAREFAGLLGGELQLRSARGQGSTFVLVLPHSGPLASKTSIPAPKSVAVDDDRASLEPGDAHLLVIEDDQVFIEVFGTVIRGQGLKYVVATDGRTGLRMARERRPSGIILDVKLPDIDGWKVMEDLHADPTTADIPVHFVSAMDAAERGMALGAVGYLTKPATRMDLVRVVASLAPRRPEASCQILVVEDDAILGDSVLQQLAGQRLDARRVTNAHDALEALQKERFACMILDLSLPDMDGLEFLDTLKERREVEMPSVLVYTARALNRSETKRLEAYAEAIVLKDGSSAERLLDEVRLFVRRMQEGLGPRRWAPSRLHPANVRLEGRKILVVDDEMRAVYALSATLRAKGMEVLTADTGRAALEVLADHADIEAVLMDIMMPEMDGYEATRRIRSDPRFRELPIIALTAKAMKGDREKCIEAGATDYLSKPIDSGVLLSMLNVRLAGTPVDGS